MVSAIIKPEDFKPQKDCFQLSSIAARVVFLVSVIIPTYNRRPFLAEAIHSVLAQTSPCNEILVIDDGSKDDTANLVEEAAWRSPVPVRYFYQSNRGAAAARNLGIAKARSEILCFLDSDDSWVPGKLEKQLAALRSSGCRISHTGEKWVRRGRHLNQKKKHRPPDGHIFAACLPMCVVGMSTVMLYRKVFDRYGCFDESLPCCEDYDFWLRASRTERFRLVPEPLTVKQGGREDQLSTIYRTGMDKYRIRSLVNLLTQDALRAEEHALVLGELERKCLIYGNGCLKHGRQAEGEYYLKLPEEFRGT